MALSLRRLDADSFLLLTLSPIVASTTHYVEPKSYHILFDPWVGAGSSRSSPFKTSFTHQPAQGYISSLAQLPVPDLIIFSKSRADSCNEAAVRQIPADAKTLILAEPTAAKVIRGWKHFDRRNVQTLKRWGDRHDWREAVTRIPLPPAVSGGRPGEVTVAYIPQARDLTGSRATVGITFRPSPMFSSGRMPGALKTSYVKAAAPPPPAMPKSHRSYSTLPRVRVDHASAYLPQSLTTTHMRQEQLDEEQAVPWPALRSARSTSALTTLLANPSSSAPSCSLPYSSQRTLSLLFSPGGVPFAGHLSSYATTHLVSEAALPLTVLLQRPDHVVNPWWLGRKPLAGVASGEEIAVRLGARCWVSCHDEAEKEEEEGRGFMRGWLRVRRWRRGRSMRGTCEDGEQVVQRHDNNVGLVKLVTETSATSASTPRIVQSVSPSTGRGPSGEHQLVHLASGAEVVVTSEGVWDVDEPQVASAHEERPRTDTQIGMEMQVVHKDTGTSPFSALSGFMAAPLEDREAGLLLAGGEIKNSG